MESWQDIVGRADRALANSQSKENEAAGIAYAEDTTRWQEKYVKIQSERDEVFKKFSVRETLDAIRRDVWGEGEIVELKGTPEEKAIFDMRVYSLTSKDTQELLRRIRFNWGGLELRAPINVPVVSRHYEHYSGGNSQADSYSGDIEHIDGVGMGTMFMTIGVDIHALEATKAGQYGIKKGKALYYDISPYVEVEWITRRLNGKSFSKASLKEKVRAGESFQSVSNGVFVDYPNAQDEFIASLASNIRAIATPKQIRQLFST